MCPVPLDMVVVVVHDVCMTRDEWVKRIASALVTLLAQPGVQMFEVPDEEYVVSIRGRVSLLVIAEWIYVRMG